MLKSRAQAIIAVSSLLACAGAAIAAGNAAPRLDLRTGAVTPAPAASALAAPEFTTAPHVLILDGPMTPDRRAALNAAGVNLGTYLPTNAFIADLSKSTPAQLRALPFVAWAGEYKKDWKIDPLLAAGAKGRPFDTALRTDMANRGLVAAHVWLFDGQPADATRAEILKIANAQVNSTELVGNAHRLDVIMPAADVARLADMPAVQFAEHMPEYTARGGNLETRWMIQTNIQDLTPLYTLGLTGQGQVVGVIDGGIAYGHCSFNDPAVPVAGPTHRKIIAYNAPSVQADFHGTHVAGTVAGDAGLDDNTRGIAYGAKLVFNQWPDPTEASQIARHALHYSQGAAIHNNSWGDNNSTVYDSACRGIDLFLHDNDDNLILFAITDFGTPVRNPENAKNVIAVSASGSAGFQEQMCVGGFGPTADGRRKPEVTAPGCAVLSSSTFGCSLTQLSGTSMSTPAVAGAAALMRQYFMSGYYPSGTATPANAFVPSGALLKAALVSSARNMTNETGYPGAREGWGRVTIGDVLGFAPDQRKTLLRDIRNTSPQALTTGQINEMVFYVSPCESVLKATLSYYDAPAAANAVFTPVNNLDLELVDPEGNVFRGNHFVNGATPPGGTADAINNLEQVLSDSPLPGRWTARVIATAVNVGPQGFALIIAGPVDQNTCGSSDFNCDGDFGTDQDIEAFFRALAGGPGDADFNRDGDTGTDQDIEAFFRVLAGAPC